MPAEPDEDENFRQHRIELMGVNNLLAVRITALSHHTS